MSILPIRVWIEGSSDGFGYFVRGVDKDGFEFAISYCFTLWGARLVAARIAKQIANGFYREEIA